MRGFNQRLPSAPVWITLVDSKDVELQKLWLLIWGKLMARQMKGKMG